MKRNSKVIMAVLCIVVILLLFMCGWVYFAKSFYKYGHLKLRIGKRHSVAGILDSPCQWKDDKCFIKAGYAFRLIDGNYQNKNFKELGRYPDFIPLDILASQFSDYKTYLSKKVIITGVLKLIKYGSNAKDCMFTQIGCQRDMVIFEPENIQEWH